MRVGRIEKPRVLVSGVIALLLGAGCAYGKKPSTPTMDLLPSVRYDLHYVTHPGQQPVFYLVVGGQDPHPRLLELVDGAGAKVASASLLEYATLGVLYREGLPGQAEACRHGYDWAGRFVIPSEVYHQLDEKPTHYRLTVLSRGKWYVAPLHFSGCYTVHNFAE